MFESDCDVCFVVVFGNFFFVEEVFLKRVVYFELDDEAGIAF